MGARMTARDLSERWNEEIRNGMPPSFWRLGDLLDDFRLRCATSGEREALVRDTPTLLEGNGHADADAYLAAVVETLCREAGMPPPLWTDSPDRFLSRPWFAGGLESLKAILLAESPVAFRRRNLFVSANALARA
jgi:hypothetical protein